MSAIASAMDSPIQMPLVYVHPNFRWQIHKFISHCLTLLQCNSYFRGGTSGLQATERLKSRQCFGGKGQARVSNPLLQRSTFFTLVIMICFLQHCWIRELKRQREATAAIKEEEKKKRDEAKAAAAARIQAKLDAKKGGKGKNKAK